MLQAFYFIHVLICIALVIVVLLQSGKGAGMSSVFGAGGGGGGETLFGSKGFGGMLAKATGVLAVAFMASSIGLSLIPFRGGQSRESVLDRLEGPPPGATQQQPQPAEMPVQLPSDQAPPETDVPDETPAEQPAETPSGGE